MIDINFLDRVTNSVMAIVSTLDARYRAVRKSSRASRGVVPSLVEVTVKRFPGSRKLCAPVVALTMGVMGVAAPCRADQTAIESARRSITHLSPTTLARLIQEQPPAGGTADRGTFFKTKKGVAVLALLGAGFGYTLYSKSHDRVLSPVR
jgi:hypothetical protein